MNVRAKPEVKRQDPTPAPPPPAGDVWTLLGKSRADFIEEHKDDLTTEVMTDIKNQMVDNINGLKSVTEFWARAISCQILVQAMSQVKRTIEDTQIEENIEEIEEKEKKDLEDLLSSFGVDESRLGELVIGLPLPEFILQCQNSPLILRTGNTTVDKEQTLAICGRFLMVKTGEAMAQHDVDTVDNFVDSLEEFMKGTLTFVHMIVLSFEVPDDPTVREFTRLLQENKLHELKRYLQNAIAGFKHRR